MAEHRPLGSSGYTAITDMAMVDSTPPAEGTLNEMLGIDAPTAELTQAHNFNMGGLTHG